jgi:hypothetical protein
MSKESSSPLPNDAEGIALPWFLTMLATSFALIAATHSVINAVGAAKQQLRAKETTEYQLTLIQALLLQITKYYDGHPFFIPPVVVEQESTTLLPAEIKSKALFESSFNAFSFLKISAATPYKVLTWTNQPTRICPMSQLPVNSTAPVRLWLSLSGDGFSIWGNRNGTRLLSGQCQTLDLEPVETISIPRTASAPGFLLLPIFGESLYYTDRKKILRHASLYNGTTIEDQPVLQVSRGLAFGINNLTEADHTTLAVTFTDRTEKKHLVDSTASIPRQPHYDYLAYWLNR